MAAMARCHTRLLPSRVIIVDWASDGNARWENTENRKYFSPAPAAGTFGGDSREAGMRGFGYDTWSGRTGDLKAIFQKLHLSQPRANSILVGIHSTGYLGTKKEVSDSKYKTVYVNWEKEEYT